MDIKRWTGCKKDKPVKIVWRKLKKNGGKNMENNSINVALDKISSKLNLLDGENGMIKLDKSNPSHKDWFDDEE